MLRCRLAAAAAQSDIFPDFSRMRFHLENVLLWKLGAEPSKRLGNWKRYDAAKFTMPQFCLICLMQLKETCFLPSS